jgi:parvulin-like peptidyl-prolyl isomerase
VLARLLREPLLHFLLLGGVLFAIFGRGGPSDAGIADRQIVVSEADIARLADGFSRTWHRPPAADELEAQIQNYIREEILYRTALAIGLDKDDTIIRRRLRQKMEFLFEDTVPVPQEAELRAYLQAHAEKFRTQPLISFRQIFVSQSRGGHAEADARQILARLVSTAAGASSEGDALLLGDDFTRMPLDQVAAQFGESFAQTMAQSIVGRWVGPLRSAYGLHLVLVTAVEPAELPPFEQVRSAVEREWFADRRAAAQAAQYQALLAGYRVVVQRSQATSP